MTRARAKVPPVSRRSLLWIVIVVLAIGAAITGYLYLGEFGTPPSSSPSGEDLSEELTQIREALLSSPYEVDVNLSIDIPKGSESDNPDHQEIDAEGAVDLGSGEGDLTYDFNDLANAGGFLGHFDEMQVLFSDDSAYLDVFLDGPAWVRTPPEAVEEDQIARLRDVLLTSPITLASYFDVDGTAQETSDGITATVPPGSLAALTDPVPAAIGTFLEERGVEAIELEVTTGAEGPEVIAVAFAYQPVEGSKELIEVVATYELTPGSTAEFGVPSEDDVREFSEIFG